MFRWCVARMRSDHDWWCSPCVPRAVYSKRNNKPAAKPRTNKSTMLFNAVIRETGAFLRHSHGVHYTSHSIVCVSRVNFMYSPCTQNTRMHRIICGNCFYSVRSSSTPNSTRPFEYMSRVSVCRCVRASVRILLHQPTQQCRRRWIAALYWRCGNRHKHHTTIQRTTEAKRLYYRIGIPRTMPWNTQSTSDTGTQCLRFSIHSAFPKDRVAYADEHCKTRYPISVPVSVHVNRERNASIRVSSSAVCVCVCV